MFFSQRKGYKSVSKIIQRDGMSEELRNSLWNILDIAVWKGSDFYSYWIKPHSVLDSYSTALWHFYLKKPLDTRPDSGIKIINNIREYYFSCEWYEVYDFIEFTLQHFEDPDRMDLINSTLEQGLSAYRFIDYLCSDITDEQEINMLEEALQDHDFPSVRNHLKRALELISDRKNPDYRNSIKESISAVESFARIITGTPKATLGEALGKIQQKNTIHPSLLSAFSKIYGYTSDEDGIRHSMLDEPNISVSDAKFFLLSCTSFINYMKTKL
ncbi:MAG: AbiJ-NTD4 domain-containing protein [Bellilinea sp.]